MVSTGANARKVAMFNTGVNTRKVTMFNTGANARKLKMVLNLGRQKYKYWF